TPSVLHPELIMSNLWRVALLVPFAMASFAVGGAKTPVPDKSLEAAIRAALQYPKGDLTDEKLNNLFILEAPDKKIRDLTGLEKCKNLASLKLTKNEI